MKSEEAEINLEYLDTMSGGDVDMRNTLLDMLIEELPRELSILLEAVQMGDVEAIFQASHSMKSTLTYTGHTESIVLNEQIEAASRQGIWGTNERASFNNLQIKIHRLMGALIKLPR